MKTSNPVLDAVLEALSIPHIEERVPRDVFYQHGLRFPAQYGIACRDVSDCIKRAEAAGERGTTIRLQVAPTEGVLTLFETPAT